MQYLKVFKAKKKLWYFYDSLYIILEIVSKKTYETFLKLGWLYIRIIINII